MFHTVYTYFQFKFCDTLFERLRYFLVRIVNNFHLNSNQSNLVVFYFDFPFLLVFISSVFWFYTTTNAQPSGPGFSSKPYFALAKRGRHDRNQRLAAGKETTAFTVTVTVLTAAPYYRSPRTVWQNIATARVKGTRCDWCYRFQLNPRRRPRNLCSDSSLYVEYLFPSTYIIIPLTHVGTPCPHACGNRLASIYYYYFMLVRVRVYDII